MAVTFLLGGDSTVVAGGSSVRTAGLFLRRDWNTDMQLPKSPDLRRSEFLAFVAGVASDAFRRHRFDLTLPIQDTFGDDGSVIGAADLPTDPDRFGNSRMFGGLQFLRFVVST